MKSSLKLILAIFGAIALMAAAFFIIRSVRPGREIVLPPEEPIESALVLAPVVGETWTYQATVKLDGGAQGFESVLEPGSDGGFRSSYEKERRFVGMEAPQEGAEPAFCFEIILNDKPAEREYSLITEEGIFSRGSQKSGQALMFFDPPILLIPAKLLPGEGWEMGLPNPNDPSGPPMVSRRFSYFGIEKLEVMGREEEAHRVKIHGKTGPIEIQRDLWYSNTLGFIKDRKSYYLPDRRLALIEENLIEHKVPEQKEPTSR